MKKIFSIAGRFISLLFFIAIVVSIILYQKGYYYFAFMPPDKTKDSDSSANSEENVIETTEYTDDYTKPTSSGNNISQITNPHGIEGIETEVTEETVSAVPTAAEMYKSLTAKIENASKLTSSGWSITDEVYKKNKNKIAVIPVKINFPKSFSYRTEKKYNFTYNEDINDYEKSSEIVTKPVLDSYMGYILYDSGTGVTLLNSSAEPVISGFADYQPAYTRDEYGRALFCNSNGKNMYYISDANKVRSVEINTSFIPALNFDYVYNYGMSKNGMRIFYKEKKVSYVANQAQIDKNIRNFGSTDIEPIIEEETVRQYGYMNANGAVVIDAQYYYAFNFSENGLAAVGDRDRNMWIINTSGNTVINPHGNMLRLKERNHRPSIDGYAISDTKGLENLGMYYYDKGLLRVRRRVVDYYDTKNFVSDSTVLIDKKGNIFKTPDGYTLMYYANGVLTLEKNGFYGCMDYTGKWIAQPIYTYAGCFSEGLSVIGFKDGKKGMIDTEGNIVLPFVYDYISEASSGVITAFEKTAGWTVCNKLAYKTEKAG